MNEHASLDIGALPIKLALLFGLTCLLAAASPLQRNMPSYRALRAPIREIGFFSNPGLLLALTVTLGLQMLTVYHPLLQSALHAVPLG